jgi:hypothetical protein
MADSIDEQLAVEEHATPFDANDPDVIAQAEKHAKLQKSRKLRVVEAIMSTEEGRAWMAELCGDCHVFSENLMRDTPERNGRFEGERGVGLRLFDQIMEAAPEMFWKMVCEARERRKS